MIVKDYLDNGANLKREKQLECREVFMRISKKIPLLLSLLCVWLLTCGFEDLSVEMSAGITSVMEDLTSEDLREIQILDEWEDKVIANVNEYVTMRAEPNKEAEALGRMLKGNGGTVVERLDGWTKVKSGNVEGYVLNDYLLFGMEAYERAQEELTLVATSTTGGLRIRKEPNTECKILKNVAEGDKLEVVEGTWTEGDEWVNVQYAEEKTGYVSAEYVTLQYELGEAMTMKEIREKEAEEKREKLKQQLEAWKANGDEVTLLAALIQAEGGNQPYEGQVAIGAVVMNRVKSPRYPNSIAEVIFAPGQFGPASNGTMARYLASGPKASCIQAAQDAINGYTTVGTFTRFKNARSSVSVDHIVIGNHVFY